MNSLQEYGDLFYKLNLTELTVEEGDKKLCLKREMSVPSDNPSLEENKPGKPADRNEPEDVKAPLGGSSPKQGKTVKAPLLGMFTSKVSAGDHVKRGDILCMIEAMKMMNEVVSPEDGTVSEILAGDGELVEFGQELFVIR